ncbi:MAG: FAM162A family protein [Puniceicoccales bacterium]|jgi:hypothetical protein|nr:FAM162A family protein [Puniceicoccales bacterium]
MEIAMLNPSNDQKNFSPFNANCSSKPLVPPKQNSYSSMGEGPSNKPTPKYMVESGWGIPCQIDFNSIFLLDPLENQKKWDECSSTHDTPASANSPTTQSHNFPSDESVKNSSERYAAELKVLKQYSRFSVLSPQGMWDPEYGFYLEDPCEEPERENFFQPSASTTFSIDQLPISQEKQPKEPECPSTTTLLPNPPESTDSTTRHLNQSSNESAQNSSGQRPPPSAFPSIAENGWGMPHQRAIRPAFSIIDQPPISLRKQREGAECPSSSHMPFRQPQVYTNEKKFNNLYSETLEKLNSQSATVTEIVDQLIWQGIIGPRILQKLCDEKISKSAEQIPEAIATWMLNALENVEDVKICSLAINALDSLSCIDGEFVAKISNLMKIDENLEKVARLLGIGSTNYDVKFLSILTHVDQAKLLSQMQPRRVSGILCMLCDSNQAQHFENNSNTIEIENTIRVLLEMSTQDVATILVQIIALSRSRCAAIILAGMPLQSRANIIMNTNYQTGSAFLSAMCSHGYSIGAVEIIKLMDTENMVLIFKEMVAINNANNMAIILRIMGFEVTMNILRKILALNLHEVAMKILIGMDSRMMGNMLFVIEEAQKARKTQDNLVEILEIFKLLSKKNLTYVFTTICNFDTMGHQFAAKILATVIEEEIAKEALATLATIHAIKIIKLMFANKPYQSRLMAILPSLAQHRKGQIVFASIRIKLLTEIVILMFHHDLDIFAKIIVAIKGPELSKELPLELRLRLQSPHDEISEKDKPE